jgi:hypothetical protein
LLVLRRVLRKYLNLIAKNAQKYNVLSVVKHSIIVHVLKIRAEVIVRDLRHTRNGRSVVHQLRRLKILRNDVK